MDYVDIIEEITGKLTGDNEKDIKFLIKESEKWKNHEYSIEILRAIGRMIAQRLPEESEKKLDNAFKNWTQFTDNILNEVKCKIAEGKMNEAEKLIKKITYEELFKDDRVSTYFSFNEPIEELYYKYKFNPKKEIRINPIINTEVFLTYAYILFEKKEYDEALKILNKGLKLNPIDTRLLFEKGEIFKIKKDWGRFKEITDLCFEYSYSSKDLARAYRNYGYMFIEQKDYDGAICCFLRSLHYDQHAMAKSELFYITQVTKRYIDIDTEYHGSRCMEILNKRGIQIGPNRNMLSIAAILAEDTFNDKQYELSHYFYGILYDLTKDDEIYEKLKNIEKIIEKKNKGRKESALKNEK